VSPAPLVAAVDELYRSVVETPEIWDADEAFAAWLADLGEAHTIDRERARILRRCVRAAMRLRDRRGAVVADAADWVSLVDAALGPKAWRPTLELAFVELRDAPDEERFEDVRRRFRVVHGTPWMEETSFAEWLATEGVE